MVIEAYVTSPIREQKMIIESLGLVAHRRNRRELRTALSFLLGPMRVEPGCISCQLYQDVTNGNRFQFECLWKAEADLIRHVRSEIYKQLLILMELSAEAPCIQFYTISQTRGLEFVHAARQQQYERASYKPTYGS